MTSNEDSCCLKNGQQLEQASEQAYVVLAKNLYWSIYWIAFYSSVVSSASVYYTKRKPKYKKTTKKKMGDLGTRLFIEYCLCAGLKQWY